MRNALIATLATIIVPGGATILVPYLILQATGISSLPQIGLAEIASLVLALLGVSMVVWVSVAFVTQGKGTPAPVEPPKNFVAAGLYRFLRNPMYFGALLTVLAETLFFHSAWLLLYVAILWLALHSTTVLFENLSLRGGSEIPIANTKTALRVGSQDVQGADPAANTGAPNNSIEPPPLRFAKHPEGRGSSTDPGQPSGLQLCDTSLGLAGRLISRPLGVSRGQ